MPKDKEYQKKVEATKEKLRKLGLANDFKAMVDYRKSIFHCATG